MEHTSIRVSKHVRDMINLLKDTNTDDLLRKLLDIEVKKRYVYTQDGYLPVGTVVNCEGDVLVIKGIDNGRVLFDDGTCAHNGGKVTWLLKKLASSIEEYDGGRLHG